jgi:membrane protein DedA with SNARE-associated domain
LRTGANREVGTGGGRREIVSMELASSWMSSSLMHELIHAYGLWIMFIGTTLEFAGIPLPGETMLISAALYAGSTHRLTIGSVVLVATLANTLGGMIGYVIGRSIGFRLLLHYGQYIRLDERRLKVGQYLFLRHGGKIVFFGKFIDPLRIFAGVLAGANRMSAPNFLLMNALGGICWAMSIGLGAYWLGAQIKHVAGIVSLLLLLVVIGLIIGGIIFFRRHERELEERAEKAIPGPLLGVEAGAPALGDGHPLRNV